MHFRILGPIEIHDETSGGATAPTGSKQRSLLGALVVKAGQVMTSHRLIDELWGENPPANAANALQAHVARLRRLLESSAGSNSPQIVTHSLGYVLQAGRDATDAAYFHRLSATGRALVGTDPERAVEVLRRALALWRGPALEGCADGETCLSEAAQLEESRLVTLETFYAAGLRAGLHGEITGELEELTAEHPVRERFYDLLMVALYRCGRQAEALSVYERARTRLAHELGVEPGPALRSRVQAVLNHAPELSTPGASSGAPEHEPHEPPAVHDLGDELAKLRSRLESLTREQQVLTRRFDQLAALTVAQKPAPAADLPDCAQRTPVRVSPASPYAPVPG